jgi:dGTPase
MFSSVYTDSAAKEDDPKTHFIVQKLFEYFCAHPDDLPDEWRVNARNEPNERRVADYIAGMTDRYAIQVFERCYVPGPWAVLS